MGTTNQVKAVLLPAELTRDVPAPVAAAVVVERQNTLLDVNPRERVAIHAAAAPAEHGLARCGRQPVAAARHGQQHQQPARRRAGLGRVLGFVFSPHDQRQVRPAVAVQVARGAAPVQLLIASWHKARRWPPGQGHLGLGSEG